MKIKIFFSSLILLLSLSSYSAQKSSLLKMGFQERKAEIKKMTPKEKTEALKQFKEDLVLSELQIPENQKDNFIEVYTEYQAKQREIKNKFRPRKDFVNMTEEEANEELENSFDIGQELLDLRKEYSEKFKVVVNPQKVLQLFQTEGMMRNKMLKHQMPK